MSGDRPKTREETSPRASDSLENLLSKWEQIVFFCINEIEMFPVYANLCIMHANILRRFLDLSRSFSQWGQALCVMVLYFLGCSTVGRGRQKTIVLKVPVHEEIQDDQESGSETSDSVSNSGQNQNTNNVTLITLNSEGKIHKWVFWDWFVQDVLARHIEG